uniref:Uncharacterized protein n=1 Tax=Daucus carota subsp. sativus TaxID=79200 RepID=A0A166GA39_DAUCS
MTSSEARSVLAIFVDLFQNVLFLEYAICYTSYYITMSQRDAEVGNTFKLARK